MTRLIDIFFWRPLGLVAYLGLVYLLARHQRIIAGFSR